ncbi:hypothetical protein NP233_g5942 [Leucocoprinus birnbaumii]|uniref:3'-5' exonuclease n=1 Tax=Leucocoprinus birnbaumii TaxID=56174 RepID=A0AAD5VS87_9AGAR|nr:hypothetical protein NP233_g5942 [Leucocoprinus birnbaumii]
MDNDTDSALEYVDAALSSTEQGCSGNSRDRSSLHASSIDMSTVILTGTCSPVGAASGSATPTSTALEDDSAAPLCSDSLTPSSAGPRQCGCPKTKPTVYGPKQRVGCPRKLNKTGFEGDGSQPPTKWPWGWPQKVVALTEVRFQEIEKKIIVPGTRPQLPLCIGSSISDILQPSCGASTSATPAAMPTHYATGFKSLSNQDGRPMSYMVVPDEDPEHSLHGEKNGEDERDREDEGDGAGIGKEDEEEEKDVNDNEEGAAQSAPCFSRQPLPRHVMSAFLSIIEECKKCVHGCPPLYAIHKMFWVHPKDIFFILEEYHMHFQPEKRYQLFPPFEDKGPHGQHGYVPSSQWFQDVYDTFIEQHKPGITQHMSMLTTKICAIDHSFKITKHIIRLNGEIIFTALLTITNEKGEIRIIVKDTTQSINDAISTILKEVPDDKGEIVLGFDSEWNVELSPQGFVRQLGKTVVVQIAYKESVFILQLQDALSQGSLPEQLQLFLLHPHIQKVGRMVNGDFTRLHQSSSSDSSQQNQFCGALDLGSLAKECLVIKKTGNCSLADLCTLILHKWLDKNTPLCTSQHWENRTLTSDQIMYVAKDAYASLMIYHELMKYPSPSSLSDTTPTYTPILLYTSTAAHANIIAKGRLLCSLTDNTVSATHVRITNSQALVEFTKVHVPGAIITSHEKCSLESFGTPPFQLICHRNHLHSFIPVPTPQPQVVSSLEIAQSAANTLSKLPPLLLFSDDLDLKEPKSLSLGDMLMGNLSDQNLADSDSGLSHPQPGASLLSGTDTIDSWDDKIHSHVLKDPWHFFYMIDVPANHGHRKIFAREL